MRCARRWVILMVLSCLIATTVVSSAAAPIDMSDYVLVGCNGERGGLPQVKIWLKKSQAAMLNGGEHGWSYPASHKPENMHYPSWRFWEFGISDALLQIICEQATDPSGKPVRLGRYFSQLTNSVNTCWSAQPGPHAGIAVDITDSTPVTESCRADHYVTYAVSPQLFFNGNARFYLEIRRDRHLEVVLISSALSQQNTDNLLCTLKNLSGHPVFSFPDFSDSTGNVELVVEFSIERQTGPLKVR
jgi:hypothetical protein